MVVHLSRLERSAADLANGHNWQPDPRNVSLQFSSHNPLALAARSRPNLAYSQPHGFTPLPHGRRPPSCAA